MPRVRDLLLGRGLIDEERGGIAGEADEEEDDGDDAPHDEDRVDEPPEQERRASPASLPQRDAAEVHVQLGVRREPQHARGCARRP